LQDELDRMRRRDFLRLGAASMAATGLNAFVPAQLADAQPGEPVGTRSAPAHPVLLRSQKLEVTLDGEDGLPYEYRWTATGARLHGEDYGQKMTALVCERASWRFFTATLNVAYIPTRSSGPGSEAWFDCTARDGDKDCATFRVKYKLADTSLFITLEDVIEKNGYELIDVAMPHLVTVREEDDEDAWLVHGDSGGSLVMLADAKPGSLPPNNFWGKINGGLPVNMVSTDQMTCVQETTAFMDMTEVAVTGSQGSRRASIGSNRVHRVNGHDCYNLNLGAGAPLNCGNAGTPNLLVEDTPSCRLDFFRALGDPAQNGWIHAAAFVRDRMPEIPNKFYHDRYMYGIRCDEPRLAQPAATFAQCEQLISDVADLTDGAPQIVHLWGWQFKGKDTGYPAVNQVDERIGGYDGMMQLMERGRAHNATITLSDNYDDAYRSSPAWNEDYIARRPDGQLWQSREWTGEVSFVQGLAKYMEGPGVERVRYTCERYKLPQTIHVDVLSYYAIRNDWDPKHPASGIRNLRQGRYRVLEEFAKHGVDVTSEGLRYPMIGKISCCWYAQTAETSPFGGKPIPLLPLVYGKSAIWGLSGGMRGDPFDLRMRHLFWGATLHDILRADVDRKQITDVFYLTMVPWMHLHRLQVTGFQSDGDRVAIYLRHTGAENTVPIDGAFRRFDLNAIEIDWKQKTCNVVLDGQHIANQDSVFCPMDENRICFYSLRAQKFNATCPRGWNPSDAVAVALSAGKREEINLAHNNYGFEVEVAAQQPVIVYRNRKLARL
jgi:hypothetical protein